MVPAPARSWSIATSTCSMSTRSRPSSRSTTPFQAVGEGLEAGCWAVGIARYSNYMDINSLEEAAALSEDEIQRRVARTRDMLWATGAHYVIDEPVELLGVIDDVNARLARGEHP